VLAVFTVSGLLAGLAGVFHAGYLTAAVIGGASLIWAEPRSSAGCPVSAG